MMNRICIVIGLAIFLQAQMAPSLPVQGTGIAASISRGKIVYSQQCLSCHQTDAGGVPNMYPPLIKTTQVLGDKSALVRIVLNGMSGNLDVNGDTYHNTMAPHSDLTDQQVADVLTYVRNSFSNKARAITAAEVKTIRANNKHS